MRAYSASSEEALRTRSLLKDWTGEKFLTPEQYQRMEQDTPCDLRRANIFLRLALFLFTLLVVAAALLLLSLVSPFGRGGLLIVACASYLCAEFVVSGRRFYRHGIEEALAVCSVGLLCAGLQALSREPLAPVAGVILSLWIWYRFGLLYAPVLTMILVVWLASNLTSSHSGQHLIVAAFYLAGLLPIAAVRSRYRFTYLDERHAGLEALLWVGIYLAINLELSSSNLMGQWWSGSRPNPEFTSTFFWTTWVLTWCLPPAILWRGLRLKDRLVILAGLIAAVLTLVTNKAYLGWPRHTWDPMILGALLIGIALFGNRWLGRGPGGVRHGFTARRVSGRDKRWIDAGSVAFGFLSPHATTVTPQTGDPEVRFGGGDSGGGGATSDF